MYVLSCLYVFAEFLATAFASEFGILSSVPFWSSLAWITLGSMIIFMVVLILMFIKMHFDRKKQHPNSFTLARFQVTVLNLILNQLIKTPGMLERNIVEGQGFKNKMSILSTVTFR